MSMFYRFEDKLFVVHQMLGIGFLASYLSMLIAVYLNKGHISVLVQRLSDSFTYDCSIDRNYKSDFERKIRVSHILCVVFRYGVLMPVTCALLITAFYASLMRETLSR